MLSIRPQIQYPSRSAKSKLRNLAGATLPMVWALNILPLPRLWPIVWEKWGPYL